MYLDFEDYRPEFTPVGHAISTREGVLIAFILHLIAIIVLLVAPRFLPDTAAAARAHALLLAQQRLAEPPRFVFVQPRLDRRAPKPPVRGELSDQDRVARTPERAPNPTNPLPFFRGNTTERVEAEDRQAKQRDAAPAAQQGQPQQQQAQTERPKIPESPNALPMPALQPTPPPQGATAYSPGGRIMSDAIEHFERHIPQQFDNRGGGGGSQIGPLQFDTKGVEFGPWVRRFVAQIRRNWNVPEAAMFMKGHVVITFNVHKNGALTDLTIIGPCPVDSFNTAAYGALVSSNPTYPLPPEYPADRAFFTVTFFYNEQAQ